MLSLPFPNGAFDVVIEKGASEDRVPRLTRTCARRHVTTTPSCRATRACRHAVCSSNPERWLALVVDLIEALLCRHHGRPVR